MNSKTCMACCIEEPISEFYRYDPSYCKPCTKKENAAYYKSNKKHIIEKQIKYQTKRYREDLNYRIRCILRGRIKDVVRKRRAGSAVRDLGCTVNELKTYLESKFQPDMSWENYGDWHIDHIIPLASFELTDRVQFLSACHYTNLQPLWKKDNLKKGSKLNFSLDNCS